jgi:rhodanese-related sulfurtransferase
MQAFELFILESQAAKERLRKTFKLPDGCRSHFEHNGKVQSCGGLQPTPSRPWKRSGRTNIKGVCAATAVIGIAAIGTLLYPGTETVTQPAATVQKDDKPVVFDAILKDRASCPEVNTAELQTALEKASAVVLDARPYDEYAVSHIPGARTVPGKPGTTPALYVADVNAILSTIADKKQPLILYCNGLNCGRSKRFGDELLKAGYQNVRRYQLGAPAWRAFGGVMQVEKQALVRLLAQDSTAVLIDVRNDVGLTPKLRNARPIPLRDSSKAKDDGRLPMTDHNTRIFVVGDNGAEARAVGEAIVHDAFHNVSFFDGSIADLQELYE